MIIVNFEKQHIDAAKALALANYQEESSHVPELPASPVIPDLDWFAENGVGVAAMEDDRLVGFLCWVGPFENAFNSGIRGAYVPLHAHGAITQGRERIYQRLYQAAAETWVSQDALSHAVTLYAHDRQALHAFFGYGFGLRCVDAIRAVSPISGASAEGFTFRILPRSELGKVRQLRRLLSAHLMQSPCFMPDDPENVERWIDMAEQRDSQIFVAEKDTEVVAFIEVKEEGENFITYTPAMGNICGAFCLPEFRGTGLFATLLNEVISELNRRNIPLLGVDYESFNPTASGAWRKYFSPYTYSVVRRIDGIPSERKNER